MVKPVGASGPRAGLAGTVGVIVTRVLFPLWLLVGAVLKLVDRSPSNLPAALVRGLGGLGLDLGFVLRYSIAVELVVVGVVWLLPHLARPVALAMLVSFLPVLAGDLWLGAASCGCFGAVHVPPWATLTMDLSLLLGVWWFGGKAPSLRMEGPLPLGRSLVAGVWSLAAVGLAFGLPAPAATATATPAPLPPGNYYLPDYPSWVGKRWQELDIARWVSDAPGDLDQGEQYVIFYRKDCSHCHDLLDAYFAADFPAPTTVIAVPERAGFPTVGLKEMPCTQCRQAELPAGCDWFLKTPVMVRLEDGVVACAAEVEADDPVCLSGI
jgi:hypothetical protein